MVKLIQWFILPSFNLRLWVGLEHSLLFSVCILQSHFIVLNWVLSILSQSLHRWSLGSIEPCHQVIISLPIYIWLSLYLWLILIIIGYLRQWSVWLLWGVLDDNCGSIRILHNILDILCECWFSIPISHCCEPWLRLWLSKCMVGMISCLSMVNLFHSSILFIINDLYTILFQV